MKILYVVPQINSGDGISRVIAVKTNYLIENYNYEIVILTQNKGHDNLFFDFNKKIVFHNMNLKGNIFSFFYSYKNKLNSIIKKTNPDRIIVCDNGLKAFMIPFVIKTKIPLLLEIHSSLFIKETENNNTFWNNITAKMLFFYKRFGASKFNQFIVETPESIKEWNIKNSIVIPNPLWFSTNRVANLSQKKVIAIGRHAYEKDLIDCLKFGKK